MMTDKTDPIFRPNSIRIDVSPLVAALATGKAVAFVGAGASIPAGFPSWKTFLENTLRRAKAAGGGEVKWRQAEAFLNQGDFPTAAELLQRGLGTQIESYVWDEFGRCVPPSLIHFAVSRLPFSLAITTNYDRLLEGAYTCRPSVRTWRDPEAFFNAIRHRRFAVVKTHGDVGNGPSIVLTKTQYRDLMHLNQAFNSCLKTLLTLRTFLFVGFSLRDPDISSLMDEARLMFGKDFGPHYALLFSDEVDEQFEAFLRDSYSIHVIRCSAPTSNLSAAQQSDYREKQVALTLNQIGGKVAVRRHGSLATVNLDDPLFNRKAACLTHLQQAISLTGSVRGEISLLREGFTSEVRHVSVIPESCMEGQTVLHTSVIGRVFMNRNVINDFIYIPDTANYLAHLHSQGVDGVTYVTTDTRVKSELAVPIFSDGTRVGVLNVESDQIDAYTHGHYTVLSRIADQIGWTYYEAKQRVESSTRLASFLNDPRQFAGLLEKSRFVRQMQMQFILYRIDYLSGKLIACVSDEQQKLLDDDQKGMLEGGNFVYRFNERSLASLVLSSRHRIFVTDADEEVRLPGNVSRMSSKGLKVFDIHGPVFGIPVQSDGHTAAIMVGWSNIRPRRNKGIPVRDPSFIEDFARVSERVHRLAMVLANSPRGGESSNELDVGTNSFLANLDLEMRKVDKGEPWTEAQRMSPRFQERMTRALMGAVLHESVGLYRVRLWKHCRFLHPVAESSSKGTPTTRRSGYVIVKSVSAENAMWPGQKKWGEYIGIRTSDDDPFCRYTLNRFANAHNHGDTALT